MQTYQYNLLSLIIVSNRNEDRLFNTNSLSFDLVKNKNMNPFYLITIYH